MEVPGFSSQCSGGQCGVTLGRASVSIYQEYDGERRGGLEEPKPETRRSWSSRHGAVLGVTNRVTAAHSK